MPGGDVLEGIRSRVGRENLCKACIDAGCRAYMKGIPKQRILVNAEQAFDAHKIEGNRCDCILFYFDASTNTLVASPIELKGGRADISQVCRQLQKGADFVHEMIPRNIKSSCRPVLIHEKGLNSIKRKELNGCKIRFRGLNLKIITDRCRNKENLKDALKE